MMMEVGRSSHYEVLGVSPHATHAEVQRAYRRLARAHHPDANPERSGSAEARAAMVAINAAWEVLGDPGKRRAYDEAIGTTPQPRFTSGPRIDDEWPEPEEPEGTEWTEGPPLRQRPSDLLVAFPVLLFLVALGMFFFSAMSESAALRTASLALVPVDIAAFVAAPLFMMLRARSRDRSR